MTILKSDVVIALTVIAFVAVLGLHALWPLIVYAVILLFFFFFTQDDKPRKRTHPDLDLWDFERESKWRGLK